MRDGIAEARGRSGAVHVRGYYRKNGTYVQPHYRTAPDGSFYNNWSTKGNVNPHTGQPGTRVSPPGYGQGSTHIPPPSGPVSNGDLTNNQSTRGSTNSAPTSYITRDQPRQAVVAAWEFWANHHGKGGRELQAALLEAGEDPGAIDGVVGSKTLQAIASCMNRMSEPTPRPVNLQVGALPETFSAGSIAAEVLLAQGQPDAVKNATWYYGRSTVEFEGGRVARWTIIDRPLKGVSR